MPKLSKIWLLAWLRGGGREACRRRCGASAIGRRARHGKSRFLPLFKALAVNSSQVHWASLLGVGIFVWLLAGCQRKGAGDGVSQRPQVLVSAAANRDVPVIREWIGTLDGSENAEIRARVSGHLLRRDYREGSLVREGDLLFEIDARPFEVALAQARSELDQAKALQLASQAEAERSMSLFRQKVISEKEFINKTQLNKASISKVKALEAAVEQAELNVQYCRVTSPVSGIAAIAKAQVGDLVGTPNSPPLTTVSTLDPIKLIFPISEEEYLFAGKSVERSVSQPLAKRAEFIQLILADGSAFAHKARLLAVDLQVSQSTGTILVTALLKNPGNVLRPGQFARARVVAQTLEDAVVVPQRAVFDVQGSYQLVVVSPEGTTEIRPVQVGVRTGVDWVISEGVKAGEQVVVEGGQNLRSGVMVDAKPWQPFEQRTGGNGSRRRVASH